jgi:hypothetical protein
MKSSVIRTVAVFSLGAACATVAGGLYQEREPTSPEAYQARAIRTLQDVQWLGRYVYKAEFGQTFIESSGIGACVPNPPTPILPANAVDPRMFRRGMNALAEINIGFMVGDPRPVLEVEKCRG